MTEVHPRAADPAAAPPAADAALAAAVAARICHDMASPLGAVANGLELLLLSGLAPTPELDLMGASVRAASARLALLRLAFGTPDGAAVAPAEIAGPLAALGEGHRLERVWSVPGELPRAEAQLGVLALLCLETALPLGGRIEFRRDGGAWIAQAAGRRLRLLPGLWESLAEGQLLAADAATPVQFALLAAVLAGEGRQVRLDAHDDRLALRIGEPA